jgi:phage shock protein PspC (stress-responsive transcriptional regulator)
MAKKLRRGEDRVIGDVCSGIAAYLDTDPTAIRVLTIIVTIFTAFIPGMLAYLACWIIMPKPRG